MVYSFGISHPGGRNGDGKGLLVGAIASGQMPRAFRVDGREVRIRRRGRTIVLEPVPESWEWLDALTGELDDDFVAAVREQPEPAERPELRKVFR